MPAFGQRFGYRADIAPTQLHLDSIGGLTNESSLGSVIAR
jgi:hypothetical protein